MDKKLYFEDLEDIKTDRIFIGSSKEDLDEEISNNMWRISIEQKMARQLDVIDYVKFINDVIDNRRDQVKNSSENHGMIFYLWFDHMASQLRFNLISDIHEKLPFQCELELTENIEPIIDEFLESPFHNGLPIDGYSGESNEKFNALKVYKTVLYK